MTSTKGSEGKSRSAKHISRSKRAGLHFPVALAAKKLKEGQCGQRIDKTAPVFLSSVLEYLAEEFLQLAGESAKTSGCARIRPKHIKMTVTADKEFGELFKDVTISGGGVAPRIDDPPS